MFTVSISIYQSDKLWFQPHFGPYAFTGSGTDRVPRLEHNFRQHPPMWGSNLPNAADGVQTFEYLFASMEGWLGCMASFADAQVPSHLLPQVTLLDLCYLNSSGQHLDFSCARWFDLEKGSCGCSKVKRCNVMQTSENSMEHLHLSSPKVSQRVFSIDLMADSTVLIGNR